MRALLHERRDPKRNPKIIKTNDVPKPMKNGPIGQLYAMPRQKYTAEAKSTNMAIH